MRKKIAAVRARFDRGEPEGLAGVLRDLENDPALSRTASYELFAMAASVDQATTGTSIETNRLLEAARAGFARDGPVDREADLCFWTGWNLARPFGEAGGARDRNALEAAIAWMRRAESLYLKCDPPLPRQARLCEAARAWILLDLGEVRAATLAFRPVLEAARLDPMLGQVAELDRIAAALAAARGDWLGAAAADLRVVDRLGVGDRSDLAREAALDRAYAFAALGRWRDAAIALERRSAQRRRMDLATGRVRPQGRPESGPARAALGRRPARPPLRVALGLGSQESRMTDLAAAADIQRRDGLDDLATEADLERAELLERIDRKADAASLLATIARHLRSLPPDRLARARQLPAPC